MLGRGGQRGREWGKPERARAMAPAEARLWGTELAEAGSPGGRGC